MFFSSKVALPQLMQWCRALKHGLDVGLSPVRIFRQQAKSGPAAIRPLAAKLSERCEQGDSLEAAFAPDRHRFPILFVELIAVGEQTGRLTETFGELEHYFETVISARKQLFAALVWPIIMYISAIMVIAIMLCILGLIGKWDPIGLGLIGPAGAAKFLAMAAVFTFVVVFSFFYIRENDAIRGKAEAMALVVPGLGSCFRAFALQRFSMALHMTSEAGLSADKALHLGFRATANDAYLKRALPSAKRAKKGNEIAGILAACGTTLFPEEYVDAVQVGEESGQIAEVMEKQAKHYRDEAARKLKTLTMLLGGAVYAMVMLMVIVLIFRLVFSIGAVYDDAMRGL
ncbi:type II secretion system F family protein [Fimbriiglobus ruber]|uniref:Type IV fimbrial assembly protein PilC n=1 Tax=Fimbriiglobus ruber TaxID=1908690 RepID=A0A225E2W3_9BACT|nr:type II secretion system F family protein [Fimbriiglobus ruber]OWK43819.1 Type IV fimbrial assembly protein PilC [Fimbriiglobus ruber]